MDIQANMRLIDAEDLFAVGSVTINGIFTIHQVRVVKISRPDGSGKLEIFLPRKKEGDHWRPVFEAGKELKKAIDIAVGESLKEAVSCNVFEDELSVTVSPYRKGDLLGYASITYLDAITIDNIRIYKTDTEGQIRLVYPYSREDEQYHPLLEVNGLIAENDITAMVKKAYEKKIRQVEPKRKERAR